MGISDVISRFPHFFCRTGERKCHSSWIMSNTGKNCKRKNEIFPIQMQAKTI